MKTLQKQWNICEQPTTTNTTHDVNGFAYKAPVKTDRTNRGNDPPIGRTTHRKTKKNDIELCMSIGSTSVFSFYYFFEKVVWN